MAYEYDELMKMVDEIQRRRQSLLHAGPDAGGGGTIEHQPIDAHGGGLLSTLTNVASSLVPHNNTALAGKPGPQRPDGLPQGLMGTGITPQASDMNVPDPDLPPRLTRRPVPTDVSAAGAPPVRPTQVIPGAAPGIVSPQGPPVDNPAGHPRLTSNISVYDRAGIPEIPDNASPYDKAEADLQDRLRVGPIEEKSIWKRLGKGAVQGLRHWVESGMPGGLAGATLAAAGNAGLYSSKQYQSDADYQRDVGRLLGRQKIAAAPIMQDLELRKAQAAAMAAGIDVRKKGLDLVREKNKPLYDSIIADKKITQDEVDRLAQAGIEVTPYDAQKYDLVYDAKGTAYNVNETGVPEATPNTSIPTQYDKQRFPVTVTGADGKPATFPVSGNQAVNAITQATNADARIKATQQNQERQQGNADRNFDLRQKQYDLSVQKEERVREQANNKYKAGDEKIKTKRLSDLDKAKQAVEAIRKEISMYDFTGKDPSDPDVAKIFDDFQKREHKAMSIYMAIIDRIQNGQ